LLASVQALCQIAQRGVQERAPLVPTLGGQPQLHLLVLHRHLGPGQGEQQKVKRGPRPNPARQLEQIRVEDLVERMATIDLHFELLTVPASFVERPMLLIVIDHPVPTTLLFALERLARLIDASAVPLCPLLGLLLDRTAGSLDMTTGNPRTLAK